MLTELDLANGSLGTVRNIIYNNCRPVSLCVEFHNEKCHNYKDKLVPIVHLTKYTSLWIILSDQSLILSDQ